MMLKVASIVGGRAAYFTSIPPQRTKSPIFTRRPDLDHWLSGHSTIRTLQ